MTGTASAAQPGAAGGNAIVRVAFQGELGAFSDEAIHRRWNGSATAIPCVSFDEVVDVVADGRTDYGILPVWNTIVGDIEAGRAAVSTGRHGPHPLIVIGEAHVNVRHQLLALPGTMLRDIASVSSHPVALAQCRQFLAAHPRMTPIAAYDTAGSARDLATHGDHASAAIASRSAAERYGLVVLQSNIQDVPINVTHFLVLGRPKSTHSRTDASRIDHSRQT